MLARLSSLILARIAAALLLAGICAQAALPVRAPLQQSHGSAFSALTFEVALAPRRGDEASVQTTPMQPAPMPVAAGPVAAAPPAITARPTPRPDSTGPPVHEFRPPQANPRAPPLP